MASSNTLTSTPAASLVDFAGTVAVVISYVFNPLVLLPLLFALVGAHVGAPAADVAAEVGIAVLFFTVVPLLYVGWLRARGVIQSLEIRDRSKRTGPLLVGLGGGVVAGALLLRLDLAGSDLLAAIVACHVLNTALLLVVTRWWKISLHCATLAGVVGVLLFVHLHVEGYLLSLSPWADAILAVALLLLPTLAWARVRSRAHTRAQAITGTIAGFLFAYVELLVMAQFSIL